ncbi:hypothetical protein PG999_010022 [Apiospora kogelbergensis]|uniref:Uncharacterized protein n=1 Tax=Apiospora kogelbergensis TaxID=1337665 RepID=A0AAW0QQ33_9PEZI
MIYFFLVLGISHATYAVHSPPGQPDMDVNLQPFLRSHNYIKLTCRQSFNGGMSPASTTSLSQSPTSISTSGQITSDGVIVSINPAIWLSPTPTIACQPPCTLVLPPWTMEAPITISLPPAIETIDETWETTADGLKGYGRSSLLVTITLPPVTTSVLDLSNIILSSSAPTLANITKSITLPPVTLTESSHGIVWTYHPAPYYITRPSPPLENSPTQVYIQPGPPGPPCLVGCGKACLINCTGGGRRGGGGLPCLGVGCGNKGPKNCVGGGCANQQDPDASELSSLASKTCATETHTECHPVCTTSPCSTVCNTYLGCDCTTSIVTDHWVSCAATSCTTTSSALITGCFLTAAATTTGLYCPQIPAADPNEGSGDDDEGLSRLGSVTTVTFPAGALVGARSIAIDNNYVVFSGTAYLVPPFTRATITSLGSHRAILIPRHVGQSMAVTVDWLSIPTKTETPPVITIGSDGKSTSAPTTTETTTSLPEPPATARTSQPAPPPKPQPTETAPPPLPSRFVYIEYWLMALQTGDEMKSWVVYTTKGGGLDTRVTAQKAIRVVASRFEPLGSMGAGIPVQNRQ